MLEVSNLSLHYDNNCVIDNLNFSLSSLNAILCPNNGGKTTLIKVLSGIIKADSGKIVLNNIKLNKKNFKRYVLNVGVVLENINEQFLEDTVLHELQFPLIYLGFSAKEIKRRVSEVSELVKVDTILDKEITKLSSYEKIKVLIAVSIIHKPKVLLLDDIFRNLGFSQRNGIISILKYLVETQKMTVLFTTSDLTDVTNIDNIFVVNKGRNVLNGNFDSIIKCDNELSKMGFAIPLMVDLSRKLQFYNLVDKIYYDVDEVVNKLWS